MIHVLCKSADSLIGADSTIQNASLHDFWQWAFSDLCDDALKGIFAEWLVQKLLGIPGPRRIGWANSDIITADGVCIEVKASSYWQSWKLLDELGAPHAHPLHPLPSERRISFAGIKARPVIGVKGKTYEPDLKSDIYVFAFQHEKDIERWNAMDLSQWEFFVLLKKDVLTIGGGSISLKKLRARQAPLSAAEFVTAGRQLIDEEACRKKRDATEQAVKSTDS